MTDWLNQHSYHVATAQTAPKHDLIRSACIDLARAIDEIVPEGVERDEAQKALQLVRMWSNAGIAIRLAPLATEEQRTVPNNPYGQDLPKSVYSVKMTCPNCEDKVTKNTHGHVNPHWSEVGYDKGRYTCEPKKEP